MKFLAIDTSGSYLSVLAFNGKRVEKSYTAQCMAKHSVLLMEKIDEVLSRAEMTVSECDFIAVTVGPGSFTGIRIGISTVKGLCFACDKPALAVTSFDCLAYIDEGRWLALVDAGHGAYYSCGYEEGKVGAPAMYRMREEVETLIGQGYTPVAVTELFEGCQVKDPCEGLYRAVLVKSKELISAEELSALYLRKSSAEEGRP